MAHEFGHHPLVKFVTVLATILRDKLHAARGWATFSASGVKVPLSLQRHPSGAAVIPLETWEAALVPGRSAAVVLTLDKCRPF